MRKKLANQIVRYNPDYKVGLTTSQIEERKKNGLVNKVKTNSEKSYLQIIFDNVFTFFNLSMISLAILLLVVVGPIIITNLSFTLILFCNTFIGILQECKCKKTLHKLKLINTNKISVIRNGEEISILPEEIYLDDVLILKPGDQIPADCIIESNDTYEVNESLMTGESRSVKKAKGDTLLAGSYLITGKCYARADKIAEDTYLYSIESKAKGFKKPKSDLIISLNKIIKTLILISIPVGIIVWWNVLLKQGMVDAVKWGSLSIVYSVPAGMVLLASVAMMVAVIKLAKKNTLTQDIYSVESLSRIDTLCLDKTGTLTDGTMTVEKVTYFDKEFECNKIISSYLSAFDTENQTSKALINKFGKVNFYTVLKSLPFSSSRKYSGVSFENIGNFILGAPEYITEDADILQRVEEYATNGLRVVILAHTSQSINTKQLKKLSANKIVAMFVIRDNIRQGVADTLNWFNENGVDIRVISGDNVKTVSYIAKQCGVKNADKYIDLSTVDTTDKDAYKAAILSHWIYGRVTPEQKADIVDILRENGNVVGMTGDGVNDIISLKKADCAVALGSGAPATKSVANFVLLDDNFNNMKEAVHKGRSVVNNIQRSSSLFIMKDILWLLLMVLPIIFGISYLYEASVISLVNTLITGIASTLLAIEPTSERIQGDFYKTVVGKALTAGIYMSLPILFIYIYSFITCGLTISAVEEMILSFMPVASICVAIAGFVVFFYMSFPFTKYRKVIFTLVTLVAILFLIGIPEFFLINGTEHLRRLIDSGSVENAIRLLLYDLFSFNIYKEFTVMHWIVVAIFLPVSSFLYIMISRLVGRVSKGKLTNELPKVSKTQKMRVKK